MCIDLKKKKTLLVQKENHPGHVIENGIKVLLFQDESVTDDL